MKARMKEFPLTVEEVRALIKKEDSKKWTWLAIGVSVIAILVGIIIWVAKKREKDLEEHYEYFDDDFDELDEAYDDFDSSIYDDNDADEEGSEVEYVKINDFMNYDEDQEKQDAEESNDKSETVKKDETTKEEQ